MWYIPLSAFIPGYWAAIWTICKDDIYGAKWCLVRIWKPRTKTLVLGTFSVSTQTCASAYIVSCHKCHRSTKLWLEIRKLRSTKSLILIMKSKKVSLYLYQESWAQRNSSHLACPRRATGLQFLVTFSIFLWIQVMWDRTHSGIRQNCSGSSTV